MADAEGVWWEWGVWGFVRGVKQIKVKPSLLTSTFYGITEDFIFPIIFIFSNLLTTRPMLLYDV